MSRRAFAPTEMVSRRAFALTEIFALATLATLVVAAGPARPEAREVPASAARAEAPTRVATLLPFVEEALTLADDEAVVVASVRRQLHRPLAEGVIDLGNPHSPSFERLAEARPDLVVGDRQIHAAIAPKLRAIGAELRLIDTTSADATLDALLDLGHAVGGGAAIDARVASLREDLAELSLAEPVGILPLFGAPGSFFAISERAWLGDLADRLGFRNLSPDGGDERLPGFVAVSDEVVSTLQPDLVVLVAHGDPDRIRADLEQRIARGGAWSSLGSAPLGVHVLDPALFAANPGLELARAARELVALTGGGDAPVDATRGDAR